VGAHGAGHAVLKCHPAGLVLRAREGKEGQHIGIELYRSRGRLLSQEEPTGVVAGACMLVS